MNFGTRSVLVTVVVLAVAGCAPKPAPVDTAADVAALTAMQDREMAAVSSGNIDSALAVYASDVAMMPPGEPAVNGADALRTWFEAFLSESSASGKYASADVTVSGDWGIVHYTGELTVTPKKGGKPTTEVIKGIHVYRRQPDGSWKIAMDVWNTDAPPPPPPK